MNGESSAHSSLSALRSANPDITAAVLVTVDGFAIEADAATNIDTEGLAALAADLIARANRSSLEFGHGQLVELYARGPQGYLVVLQAGNEQALVCLAESETTVGLLLRDARKAAAALA
jgi:predicted regulator of Ras-like GTPase activity (Roadblock/LC7/MglB family)